MLSSYCLQSWFVTTAFNGAIQLVAIAFLSYNRMKDNRNLLSEFLASGCRRTTMVILSSSDKEGVTGDRCSHICGRVLALCAQVGWIGD